MEYSREYISTDEHIRRTERMISRLYSLINKLTGKDKSFGDTFRECINRISTYEIEDTREILNNRMLNLQTLFPRDKFFNQLITTYNERNSN